MPLQKEVWVAGIKENPVPNNSFVLASTDMSEYVEANTLHLAEAGIEPAVHENYFEGNEDDLPIADIDDIPNEVVLKTYSTERTRHRNLQDVELAYNKRESLIGRHKKSLAKNLGVRAAYAWSPAQNNDYNKIINLDADASVIEAVIDLEEFYTGLDITDNLNICFSPAHMSRIKKENLKIYKEIVAEGTFYGFKVWRYSKNPLYTSVGVKKPYGSTKEAGDKVCTFTWVSDEVFRCFGDVEPYETLRSAASQADELSFAQRALIGKIRSNSPKYHGAIL